jgi:transcriptional regulator with XRE-family HTH domain
MRKERRAVEYPECGLDNVVLVNVPARVCDENHVDLQIPAIDNLHLVLARTLVARPFPLKGQEVRFLRKYLGYSARAFARHIGLNYVTLSKFENDRTRIPRRLDSLIRLFAAQAICEREGQAFPERLIPVLEQLEADTFDAQADLRVEHVALGGTRQMASSKDVWRRAHI